MADLKITTIQTHLVWEDVGANITHFNNMLNALKEQTDVVVLPEMFTTGFTMSTERLAEMHGGKGLQWMIEKAKEKEIALVGSISVKDQDGFYNRLYWVNPDGSYQYYNKRHLFRMGNEQQYYTAGNERLIVDYKGWKICPLVCYDLRFPIWSRNTKQNSYDALIYVANWPEVRSYPWKQLLIARAIENQSYVIGVNRIGEDGNQINHSGDTMVLNPRGEKISETLAHQELMETITLSEKYLSDFRKIFPVMLDSDDFKII